MPVWPAIITVSLNPAIDRVMGVENFTLGAHQTGREVSRIPAGKAVNVSRVLAALNVRSIATGFLGQENRASFDSLFSNGLVSDEFFLLPGRTRENVTITDRETGQETHIRDAGLKVERRYLDRLAKKLSLLSRPLCVVIFSGSLPPGAGPEDLVRLVDVCTAAGARVAVDTSGEAIRAMVGKQLWLVKPNATELEHLVGRKLGDLRQQLLAGRELASHVRVVLLTRGGEGACLLTPDLALHGRVSIGPERLRNTVGCGDVLLGAFVAGTWRGLDVRQAFVEAVACASASACSLGTAEFDPDVVEELRSKVQVTEL